MTVMTGRAFLFVQHERDRQVHLILRNLSIFAPHLLFLDPCAADVPNRLAGPGDSLVDASSKLFADVELISVTLATDMWGRLADFLSGRTPAAFYECTDIASAAGIVGPPRGKRAVLQARLLVQSPLAASPSRCALPPDE
jgi:hypothetical protein